MRFDRFSLRVLRGERWRPGEDARLRLVLTQLADEVLHAVEAALAKNKMETR